jgi:parallel beta-helix repeat protein
MKRLLSILLLVSSHLFATDYYFDATNGLDANAGTIGSPKQTISVINTLSGTAGNNIYLKRGEVWSGTLSPTASNVTFAAYGSGAKPIITGLTTISSWTNISGNIWEATVPGGLSTLSVVVKGGALIPMGRWPNAGTANAGYAVYTSHSAYTSITDPTLTGTPNWTGAEVVIRVADWSTVRAPITNHSTTTITYSSTANNNLTDGNGYFIQNAAATLDAQNEWYYYDASGTKKIQMYSVGNPGTIQVSTVDKLVNLVFTSPTTKTGITFRNINFTGSNGEMVDNVYANYTNIDSCDFAYGGISMFKYATSTYPTISNCTGVDINMCGIYEVYYTGCTNSTFINNTLTRVGVNPGMISPINATYAAGNSSTGIAVGSDNVLIKNNNLSYIGYNGITLRQNRNNTIVRKNEVSYFCIVKNDGGGIYNGGQRGLAAATGVYIDSNIVHNSVGAPGGTTLPNNPHAKGIYLDSSSLAVNILNNTVYDCFIGLSISASQNNTFSGNTVYNSGNFNVNDNTAYGGQFNFDDGYNNTKYNTITNNIFFAKSPNQLLMYHSNISGNLDSIGTINNNIYAMPFNNFPFYHVNSSNTQNTFYTLQKWKNDHPVYNSTSVGSPISIPYNTIVTTGSDKCTNGAFTSNITGWTASSTGTVHTLSWDNTNQLGTGGSLKLITSTVSSNNETTLISTVGAINTGTTYVVRFTTRGNKFTTVRAYIQKWYGDYTGTSVDVRDGVDTTIQQHEMTMTWTGPSITTGAILLQFSQDANTVYVEDVQVYETSSVTTANPDTYFRFEVNNTNVLKTVGFLGLQYKDARSSTYNNFITLQPYSSAILFANGTAPVPTSTDKIRLKRVVIF